MSWVKDYALADFPNQQVNGTVLLAEIAADPTITTAPTGEITVAGQTVRTYWKAALSPQEEAALDALVAAHAGDPSPDDKKLVEVTNKPNVYVRKPDMAGRAYIFSIDFCDRRTWYVDALKITDEAVGVGDGVTTIFTLDHGTNAVANEAILDLTRGLVTDDHLMVPTGGVMGDYKPVVKIDGVAQTMREPYEASGGDYDIDFTTGQITFFVAPADGAVITVTYYYVPATAGPKMIGSPPAGKKWTIDMAEAQITADFATDAWFSDTILMNVFHKASGLADPANEVRYYNYGNLLDYSVRSHQVYAALTGARGLSKPTHIFRWEYLAPIVLTPDFELRAWTQHGRPLNAERATVVMYALQEDL